MRLDCTLVHLIVPDIRGEGEIGLEFLLSKRK